MSTRDGHSEPLISVDEVSKVFTSGTEGVLGRLLGSSQTRTIAVDEVTLDIQKGDIIGLVGESGCGKTTTAKLIGGTTPPTDGKLTFRGTDISAMDDEEQRDFRRSCQMIFQDPFQVINPTFTVRKYLTEPLRAFDVPPAEWEAIISEALRGLNLQPAEYLDKKAHELSGGERQRIHIASALVLDPEILICDEPASMLDVSVRASLLNQIRTIAETRGMTIVFISHDLAITRYLCDEINVMYRGRIVERGPAETLVDDPKHPYTQTLVSAVPSGDPESTRERIDLPGLGEAESADRTGCLFKERCPEAYDECEKRSPELERREETDHEVSCHLYEPAEASSKRPNP